MNWDQIEGKWHQTKGAAKQQWGKLTDDDLEYVAGHRESLIGKLEERYGYAKEEAQKRADEWIKSMQMKTPPMKEPQSATAPPRNVQQKYQETGKR
jgi:uncharacterized protein YjbJ (UPF0337 family)